MGNASLRAGDTISGQEGQATAKIGNQIHKLFMIKDLEAVVEKEKEEVKTLGNRGTGNKTVGWKGTGSMTMHYATSIFRKMILEYVKNGKDVYFDITVTNDDPTSSLGKQTTVLYGCNLDSTIIAKLDVDSAALDEDVDFTFEDFDILDEFEVPAYLK